MATIRDTAQLAEVLAAFGALARFDSRDADEGFPGWIVGAPGPLRQGRDTMNHQDAANGSLVQRSYASSPTASIFVKIWILPRRS